jgi:hypothetical protein
MYDSEDGYVWPQVYSKKPDLDEKMNHPIKVLRLTSDPYAVKRPRKVTGSFGMEIEND